MPGKHERRNKEHDNAGLRSRFQKSRYGKNGRDRRRAYSEGAGEKNDGKAEYIRGQAPYGQGKHDKRTGHRDAFAAFEMIPDRKIVSKARAKSGIENSQRTALGPDQETADQAGRQRLPHIAGQDKKTVTQSKPGGDIGHPRIAAPHVFRFQMEQSPGHDLSRQDIAENITDQQANDPQHDKHPFRVWHDIRLLYPL